MTIKLELQEKELSEAVKDLLAAGILREATQRVELSTADQVVEAALGHLRRAKGEEGGCDG